MGKASLSCNEYRFSIFYRHFLKNHVFHIWKKNISGNNDVSQIRFGALYLAYSAIHSWQN